MRDPVQAVIDAERGAVAVALAAMRGDQAGFIALVKGAPNQAELMWQLARLPAVMALGVSRRFGAEVDAEGALTAALASMPRLAEEIEIDEQDDPRSED